MTVYMNDDSGTIIGGVRTGMMPSVFEDEIIIEAVGPVSLRLGVTREEAQDLIGQLARGLSLLPLNGGAVTA